ncbi:MAG: DUF4411 family protein [bacterium]|nr:DUF4411 family protein [bacterium]
MPLRLLDANVFIQAKNSYYSFDLVPAFWSWLHLQANAGALASIDLVYTELKDGSDELAQWVKGRRQAIFHVGSSSPVVAGHIASLYTWAQGEGYKPHTIRDFMASSDPFLVGAAASLGAMVVTQETPAGNSRKKVKIPDACKYLGVSWENTFEMMLSLGAQFTL